jgi:hypothetical protein
MRTNVVIDDDLMESALKVSGLKTKKDAIEEGLKLLVQVKSLIGAELIDNDILFIYNNIEARISCLETFEKRFH